MLTKQSVFMLPYILDISAKSSFFCIKNDGSIEILSIVHQRCYLLKHRLLQLYKEHFISLRNPLSLTPYVKLASYFCTVQQRCTYPARYPSLLLSIPLSKTPYLSLLAIFSSQCALSHFSEQKSFLTYLQKAVFLYIYSFKQ